MNRDHLLHAASDPRNLHALHPPASEAEVARLRASLGADHPAAREAAQRLAAARESRAANDRIRNEREAAREAARAAQVADRARDELAAFEAPIRAAYLRQPGGTPAKWLQVRESLLEQERQRRALASFDQEREAQAAGGQYRM